MAELVRAPAARWGRALAIAAVASALQPVAGGASRAQTVTEIAAELRDKALAGSPAYAIVQSLTDEAGARPAGSPGARRAMDWGLRTLNMLGFQNVHAEAFAKDAWVRGAESAEITGAEPQRLAVLGLGGSVPTPPGGIEAPIALFHTYAEFLGAPSGVLAGRIAVVIQPLGRAKDDSLYEALTPMRTQGPAEAARRGALAYLVRSLSTAEDRLPHTGWMAPAPIPAAALSPADASLLDRMAARGGPVTVRLSLDSRVVRGAQGWNVVGEIRGRAQPDQVVVIGGHLDCWDPGRGALDDGAGVAITMAAAKLIGDLPLAPRRTVRVVLFGSEETGGSGSAYAAAHNAEAGRIVLVAESDSGAGPAYRLRLPAGGAADPALAGLAQVLAPVNVALDTAPSADGGADIGRLQALGAPVLEFAQDLSRYFDVHHSANDVLEQVDAKGLDQNVAAWAAVIYAVAESGVEFKGAGRGH